MKTKLGRKLIIASDLRPGDLVRTSWGMFMIVAIQPVRATLGLTPCEDSILVTVLRPSRSRPLVQYTIRVVNELTYKEIYR